MATHSYLSHHRLIALLVVVLLAACGSGASTGGGGDTGGGGGGGGGDSLGVFATEMLAAVNQERAAQGLAALTWDARLAEAATEHAQDMIDNDFSVTPVRMVPASVTGSPEPDTNGPGWARISLGVRPRSVR